MLQAKPMIIYRTREMAPTVVHYVSLPAPCRPPLARGFASVACPNLLKQVLSRRLQPLGGRPPVPRRSRFHGLNWSRSVERSAIFSFPYPRTAMVGKPSSPAGAAVRLRRPQGAAAPSGLSAAAPNPPARVWTAQRVCASCADTSRALHAVSNRGGSTTAG